MKFKNLLFIFLVFLVLGLIGFQAIKTKKEATNQLQQPESSTHIDTLPHDFIEFYEQFQSDSIFQKSRIVWPLKGIKVDSLTTLSSHYFQEDNWQVHQPFNDMGGTFTRDFINYGPVIEEVITDNGENFIARKRYSKITDGWHLIFYEQMHLIPQNESNE